MISSSLPDKHLHIRVALIWLKAIFIISSLSTTGYQTFFKNMVLGILETGINIPTGAFQ